MPLPVSSFGLEMASRLAPCTLAPVPQELHLPGVGGSLASVLFSDPHVQHHMLAGHSQPQEVRQCALRRIKSRVSLGLGLAEI